jgi:hypothetical protein
MRVSQLAELSRAEHLPPWIVCESKPLKTTMGSERSSGIRTFSNYAL